MFTQEISLSARGSRQRIENHYQATRTIDGQRTRELFNSCSQDV